MLNEKRVMALINHVGNDWPRRGCPARSYCDLQDNYGKDDDVMCGDVIKGYIQEGEEKQNDNQSNNDQAKTGEASTASTYDPKGTCKALRRQTKDRPRLRAGS